MTTQMTDPRGGVTGATAATDAGGRSGRWGSHRLPGPVLGLLTLGAYVVLQVAQLLLLRRLAPRFFWFDDSQAQFGPMTWWMGQHLQGGRPPLMDPEQGMAGNLAADMQYGALDPLHWGLQALAARTDDFLTMSWVFAAISVMIMGTGVLALLRTYGVPRLLAVVGALGVASSGFFLWYGGAWWPLLWSVGWLPWFWFGLVVRRWYGVAVLGLATWALLASGNPYVLFFALALVLAQAWEQVRDGGGLRVLLEPLGLARLAAMVGGLALAMPTLLTTVQTSPYISRQSADPIIGNIGFGVSNLADVLLGGPTLMGQTNAWSGDLGLVPAMYTLIIAAPLLALVNWRMAARAPGVLTAGAVYALAVVFTQLPTTVSVFRYPVRYLVVVQVTLPILVLLAVTAAPLVTRRRLKMAGALIVAQAALALFRAPVFGKWHALAAVLTALAVAAFLVHRSSSRRVLGAVASVVLVALTWGTAFVGEQMMVSLHERMNALNGVATTSDTPHRALYPGEQLGTTAEQYRAQAAGTVKSATVITYDFGKDSGWSTGVLRGNGNLISDVKTGSGSFAVWQAQLNEHWCRTYQGATCGDPAWLLATAPGTGEAWVDLLSEDTVLLNKNAPDVLRQHFDDNWTLVDPNGEYVEYQRQDNLPGRVTFAEGVTVTQQAEGSRMGYGDEPMDTYSVSTGDKAGTMAFRIPFWPGLTATLGGRSLPVDTVDGAVLSLDVPAGVQDQTLDISYVPIGQRILVPASAAGGLLVLLAAVTAGVVGGRRSRDGRGSPATTSVPE
ncbi:MAG: hypothetical protein JWR70_561 [Modestobacter sp.]|nr:hypothetical protein [Modestobacter sp.]